VTPMFARKVEKPERYPSLCRDGRPMVGLVGMIDQAESTVSDQPGSCICGQDVPLLRFRYLTERWKC
jgi:hypothetical protein